MKFPVVLRNVCCVFACMFLSVQRLVCQLDVRNSATGEIIFKDNFNQAVAGIVTVSDTSVLPLQKSNFGNSCLSCGAHIVQFHLEF